MIAKKMKNKTTQNTNPKKKTAKHIISRTSYNK